MERRLFVDAGFAVGLALFLVSIGGVAPVVGGEGEGRGDPTAMLLIEQGLNLYQAGQADGALASFELAAQVDPTSVAARLNAARVTLKMGSPEGATRHLQALLSRYPGHAEGMALWSRLHATPSVAATAEGGGFFEFGLMALVGALFTMGIAAYDVGHCPPTSQREETTEKGSVLPFCRIRPGESAGEARDDAARWIEAA